VEKGGPTMGFSRRAAKRNAPFLEVHSTPVCRHPLTRLLPVPAACGGLHPKWPCANGA